MMSLPLNDIKHRKALSWAAFWKLDRIWKAKYIPVQLKINIFKTAVLTIFTHGCECWIIKLNESSINLFATSCYRIILGVKRLDKVTNVEIYQWSAQIPLMSTIRARQLRWIGRDKSEPRKGHTRKPTITYKHQIASILTSMPELLATAAIEAMASDRNTWRKFVVECSGVIE